MSAARSPEFVVHDQHDIEVTGKSFENAGVAVTIEHCQRVKVHDLDFRSCIGGIYVMDCQDVVIEDCRFLNIGGAAEVGSGKNNAIQLNRTTGGAIRRCKILGGQTEDAISMYRSGGTAAAPFVIEEIAIEGLNVDTMTLWGLAKAWTSGSGTGCILGDEGGSYIELRHFTMLRPGQVGVQIITGTGHKVHDGIIYADPRGPKTSPNVGVSSYQPDGVRPPTAEVYKLRVNWRKNDESPNPFWWQHPDGINAHDNQWNADIDPDTLKVKF